MQCLASRLSKCKDFVSLIFAMQCEWMYDTRTEESLGSWFLAFPDISPLFCLLPLGQVLCLCPPLLHCYRLARPKPIATGFWIFSLPLACSLTSLWAWLFQCSMPDPCNCSDYWSKYYVSDSSSPSEEEHKRSTHTLHHWMLTDFCSVLTRDSSFQSLIAWPLYCIAQ